MGIIADIFEDSSENYGQFIDTLESKKSVSALEIGPKLSMVECPLCQIVLTSEANLKYHMLHMHANKYLYVKVNGEIVNNYTYVKDKIDTIEIILIGHEKAKVVLTTDIATNQIDFTGRINLKKYLKKNGSGKIELKIVTDNLNRNFTIYSNSLPDFHNQQIDKAALELLFLPLNMRDTPNYGKFQREFIKVNDSSPECRYASGLHDYALAFYMAMNKNNEAKHHFESAFSNLSPFKTFTAITARRVLALRMNCFNYLTSCGESSRFYVANLFFNLPYNDVKNSKTGSPTTAKSFEYGVYIDVFTETFLNALNAYYSRDFGVLKIYCDGLQKMISEKDQNNYDKLTLLLARMARQQGNIKEAQSEYQILYDHPIFACEAREAINEFQ